MQAYNEDGRLTSTLEEGVYEVIQVAIPLSLLEFAARF